MNRKYITLPENTSTILVETTFKEFPSSLSLNLVTGVKV
jgi:hypothetical protein